MQPRALTMVAQQTGLMGDFELSGKDLELLIKHSALESTQRLTYKGVEIELKTVKLRELRDLLTKENIINALNPTKEEIEAE